MIKLILSRLMVRRTKKRLFPVEYLEQKHVDLNQPYPNDSSYFYGSDKSGNAFIARLAFRGPDRSPEYWFDFHLKDSGFFGLKTQPGPEMDGFRLGNLKWVPEETGKKWRITYQGEVTDQAGKKYNCSTNLLFTGEHPLYDYANSSDKEMIARAIASEKWTRAFFHNLKDTYQTHYEQTGTLAGTIELDGKKHELFLRASRDHSFGSRNWLSWDRHYWITGISDNGFHWTVTTIKWDFLGRLSAGFVTDPSGQTDAIIDCTNLETVSKNTLLPDHGIINIRCRSGADHTVEFSRHGHFPYLMDGKYQMREGIGTYKFNGTDGLGMVEFGFHADKYLI